MDDQQQRYRDALAQYLVSEKDQRPYWETDHRGMVMPLVKSGYNNSVSYGVPGIAGGSAWGVLNDIISGRQVAKGEIEQAAGDAAGAAMTGSLAASSVRPKAAAARLEPYEPASLPIAEPVSIPYYGKSDIARMQHNDRLVQSLARDAGSMPQSGEIPLWHGTGNVFDRFNPGSQIGPHFGTQDQANHFAFLRGGDPNVVPVKLNTKNPLDMPDMQRWMGDEVAAYLEEVKGIAGAKARLDAVNRRHNGPGIAKAESDELRKIVNENGYDSIRYANAAEAPGFSYIATTPGTVRNAITGEIMFANAPTSAAAPSLQHIAQTAAREQTPGIRAYHGSPHDFDKFDLSKIGTGEGAQAYGHGLYFAENEGVAKQYRDALAPKAYADRKDPVGFAADRIGRAGVKDDTAKWLLADAFPNAKPKQIDQWIVEAKKEISSNPGKMYEVNIKADPADFLDWDKPLGQQGETGRKAAATLGPSDGDPLLMRGHWRVTDMMERARDQGGKRSDVTERLREAGIPGIKYLDQGSRGAGEGSRNYVVFDENLVEILRKYGLAGLFAGMGAMGANQPAEAK